MTLFGNDPNDLPSTSTSTGRAGRPNKMELLRTNEYQGDIARLLSEEEEESDDALHVLPISGGGSGTNKLSSNVSGAFRTLDMAFTSKSNRPSTLSIAAADGLLNSQEELTDKAVTVVQRVLDKLTGLDFQDKTKKKALEIPEQVDMLIKQATSNENLSTCFIGWCAFW
jgi:hypothetical protein